MTGAQPTVDQAVEILMKLIYPSSIRGNIEFWRGLYGNDFADSVQKKARAAWKQKNKK